MVGKRYAPQEIQEAICNFLYVQMVEKGIIPDTWKIWQHIDCSTSTINRHCLKMVELGVLEHVGEKFSKRTYKIRGMEYKLRTSIEVQHIAAIRSQSPACAEYTNKLHAGAKAHARKAKMSRQLNFFQER